MIHDKIPPTSQLYKMYTPQTTVNVQHSYVITLMSEPVQLEPLQSARDLNGNPQ